VSSFQAKYKYKNTVMKKQSNLLSQFLHCSFLGLFSFVTSTLILTSFPTFAHSADVTIAWDPNTDPDLAGYKIYYKTESSGPPYNGTGFIEGDSPIDVGNQMEFTLHGLIDDVNYFFAATAYDTEELESDYSEELIYNTDNHPPTADAGNDRGCFIATAAYGSRMANEVVMLRNFRDNVLLQTSGGRSLVKLYYKISPPVANYIRSNKVLEALTRFSLMPLIYGIKYPKTFVFIFFLIVTAIPLTLKAMISNRL
jgi:hypothetical protein